MSRITTIVLMFGLVVTAPMLSARADDLVSAVLPSSRGGVIGQPVTAFATVINTSGHDVHGCSASTPISSLVLTYQTTDAANQLTGTVDTPVDIPTGGSQTFVVSLTSQAVLAPTAVPIIWACTDAEATVFNDAVNALTLSIVDHSTTTLTDIIAIGATTTNDGILHLPATGAGAMAVAAENLGDNTVVNISPAMSSTGTPAFNNTPGIVTICETTGSPDGSCIACQQQYSNICSPQGTYPDLQVTWGPSQIKTFAIFFNGGIQALAFEPDQLRLFLNFEDESNQAVGGTSVALVGPGPVTTLATINQSFGTSLYEGGVAIVGRGDQVGFTQSIQMNVNANGTWMLQSSSATLATGSFTVNPADGSLTGTGAANGTLENPTATTATPLTIHGVPMQLTTQGTSLSALFLEYDAGSEHVFVRARGDHP